MNGTPLGNRVHIAAFGRTNTGKSSLLNALAGQAVSIVSESPGTTTDPVHKTMELAGLGPVVFFDTAGLDDTSALGGERIRAARDILRKSDFCLLVSTSSGWGDWERNFADELKASGKPFLVVLNKSDLPGASTDIRPELETLGFPWISVSALSGEGIREAREAIIRACRGISSGNPTVIGDLIRPGGLVLLVVPIDTGAPKGRLILPQVQVIRDALDNDAMALVVKERELLSVFREKNIRPDLVICDSQVVLKTVADTPPDIPLTTFSILFSRLKGDLPSYVKNASAVDRLKDGDKVLILEACTHHDMQDDIGRVKIPRWVRQHTGKDIIFETNSGPRLTRDLSGYALVVACGGCMINRQEMLARTSDAAGRNVPITNYGVLISHVQGVLKRVLSPFPYESGLI
jgi:[FeFe] hydrogenase H-cluster maturation GTPase HydF